MAKPITGRDALQGSTDPLKILEVYRQLNAPTSDEGIYFGLKKGKGPDGRAAYSAALTAARNDPAAIQRALANIGLGTSEGLDRFMSTTFDRSPASGRRAGDPASQAGVAETKMVNGVRVNIDGSPAQQSNIDPSLVPTNPTLKSYGSPSSGSNTPVVPVGQITPQSNLNLGATLPGSQGIDYTFHAGSETIDQYNARIAKARGLSGALPGTAEAGATVKVADTMKSEAQTRADKLTADMTSLLERSKGKEAALASELDKTGGANDINEELTRKTNEIRILAARQDELNRTIEGKPITMDSIIGAKAQANAVLGAQIGVLTAEAQALMGNYEIAVDTAQRAVDRKYGPILEELAIKEKQLALLKPTLDAEEKRRAETLEKANQDARDALNIKIANEKDLNATLLNLMQTYPDAGISLKDSIETANLKITSKSKIYKDKIATTGGRSTSGNGTAPPTPIDKNKLNGILAGIRLPLTTADSRGAMTQSALNKVVSKGVPLNVAQGIWANIVAGNSLEEIRSGLAGQVGRDLGFGYLDKFMQSLQT